jgi:hypothetical protein
MSIDTVSVPASYSSSDLRQRGVKDVTEHLHATDEPLGGGARELTGQELKLVAGGWGLSLGDGFSWSGFFHQVVQGALVGFTAGGFPGAISGAELGGINYTIHHPPTLK